MTIFGLEDADRFTCIAAGRVDANDDPKNAVANIYVDAMREGIVV